MPDTDRRPRLGKKTSQKLEEIQEMLERMEEEGADVRKFYGDKTRITQDQIINHALTALEEKGLID